MSWREDKTRQLGILLVTLDKHLTGNPTAEVRRFHKENDVAQRLVDGGEYVPLSDEILSIRYSGCTGHLSRWSRGYSRFPMDKWFSDMGQSLIGKIEGFLDELY